VSISQASLGIAIARDNKNNSYSTSQSRWSRTRVFLDCLEVTGTRDMRDPYPDILEGIYGKNLSRDSWEGCSEVSILDSPG
jgi:hypothetical protein